MSASAGAQPLMRTPLPGVIARYMRGAHLDPDPVLARHGLPTNADAQRSLVAPIGALDRFYEDVAREIGRPDLGLDMVDMVPRGAHGLVEFSIRSSPTVREALRRLARYAMLINECTVVELDETEHEASCRVRVPGAPFGLGRHPNEFFIALLLRRGRELSIGPLVPQRVWFAHDAPANIRPHVAAFGTNRIEFGHSTSGFAIPPNQLDAPLRSADPVLMQAIDEYADEHVRDQPTSPDLVRRVRDAIGAALRSEGASLETVARRLGMKPRTLQRHLTRRHTTFRRILDGLRAELAIAYRARGIPEQDIAYLLGYAEMGPFRRASRRWTLRRPAKP